MLMFWVLPQQADHTVDDRTELVVTERPDQDAYGVMATVFAPLP